MALSFDGSTQYLSYAGAPLTAVPLSMSAWFYKTSAAATGNVISLGASTTAARMSMQYSGSEDVTAVSESVLDGADNATSSGAGANNVWTHGAVVFASATSRTAYRDGGNSASNTTTNTPLLIDQLRIGLNANSTGGGFWPGYIAEVALWNIDLAAAEVLMLSKGLSPLSVRPGNLVAYWPLLGRYSPEIDLVGRYEMTLNAAPTQIAHPRIFNPGRPLLQRFTVPAAPTLVPRLTLLGAG